MAISQKDFQAMPLEEKIGLIQSALEGVCDEPHPLAPPSSDCFSKALPWGNLLSQVSVPIGGGVLTGLFSHRRKALFQTIAKNKSAEEIALLLLSLPTGEGPELLISLSPQQQISVVATLQSQKNNSARLLLESWMTIQASVAPEFAARWLALRTMPDDLLAAEFRALNHDGDLGVEVTVRKDSAAKFGNGLQLPAKKVEYRGLKISRFFNSKSWTLTGEFFDNTTRVWKSFRYVAYRQELWVELWVDEKFIFTTIEQDNFFHSPLFAWAKQSKEKRDFLPKNFGALSFQRVDEYYPVTYPCQMPAKRGGFGVMLFNCSPVETKAKKSTREYYFEGGKGHLLKIVWDTAKDDMQALLFLADNNVPSPIPLDDAMARSLIPMIQPLSSSSKDQNQLLHLLKTKLKVMTR